MIRPLEGGVSDFQVQDQDQGGAQPAEEFVPRRSDRLKNLSSISSCGPITMRSPSSASIAVLTDSTENRWRKKCVSRQRQTTSARMPGGFSLVNVQWASFATGVSATFVVAIIAVAVIICCWLRAKGKRCSKHRHSQLLSAVTSAIVPGPPSSRSPRGELPEASGSDVSAFEAAITLPAPSENKYIASTLANTVYKYYFCSCLTSASHQATYSSDQH